jgi:acetyltransferase-like isoleucine patch superfamily enzyme
MHTDPWREPARLNGLPRGEHGRAEARGNDHGFDASAAVAAREPKRGILRAARLAARRAAMCAWRLYYVRVLGMEIDESAWFSLKVHFDRTHPRGVHVGRDSYVAFGATVLTHDMTRGIYADTRIGERCFIGAHSLILPGVTIGDGSVVGAGSVVTRDVPPATIVAGNPARVIRAGITTYRFGCLWNWEGHGGRQPRGP